MLLCIMVRKQHSFSSGLSRGWHLCEGHWHEVTPPLHHARQLLGSLLHVQLPAKFNTRFLFLEEDCEEKRTVLTQARMYGTQIRTRSLTPEKKVGEVIMVHKSRFKHAPEDWHLSRRNHCCVATSGCPASHFAMRACSCCSACTFAYVLQKSFHQALLFATNIQGVDGSVG